MFPALVNGVAVDDLAHLPGALAIAVAMREARPDQIDAALHSAIALSATANNAAKGAPLHAAIWQRIVMSTHEQHGRDFWRMALSLCTPFLNRGAYVHCLHGVGHAAMKLSLYEPTAAPSGGAACTPRPSSLYLNQPTAISTALHTCNDDAPSRGLAHECFWCLDGCDRLPQPRLLLSVALPSSTGSMAHPTIPAMPHLNMPSRTIRIPCDYSDYPGVCFARYFGGELEEDDEDRRRLVEGPPHDRSAKVEDAADHCVTEPMASERHVRGCVFGLALNAASDNLEDGATHAEWCIRHFNQTRMRLLACIAGGKFGVGYGTVAADGVPYSVVANQCAREAEVIGRSLPADRTERAMAVCLEAGTLCSAPGSTCRTDSDFLREVAVVLDA